MKYLNDKERDLYHAKQNSEPVGMLIPISIFLLFCKGGIIVVIGIWILYALWCNSNNEALDNDPVVLKKREEYEKKRKHLESREWEEDPAFQASFSRLKELLEEDRYKRM